MSFTAKLKEEIIEKENHSVCCDIAELAGIVAFSSSLKNGYLKITIENKVVARRIVRQLKKIVDIQAGIEVKKQGGVRKNDAFVISVVEFEKLLASLKILENGNIVFPKSILQNDCCKKAFIRGAFLGGGSVADPQKRYHLEFVSAYEKLNSGFCTLFSKLGLRAGKVERRGKFVTYFKDCDAICDVLALAGVMNGVVEIYEVKVIKDKKNELNRLNNSEVANIYKAATAGAEQKKCIEKIRDAVGLDSLPEQLRKLAKIRLEYPEDGLAQLGQRLNPPIGKSGVNHRMRKIMEISKRY